MTKFGHFRYREASPADLVDVGPYRQSGRIVQLRRLAAEAFRKMAAAALAEHVVLLPISGFREIAYQDTLFRRAVEKYLTPAAAARWVAPPGYSEHHTGLALDVGDGSVPEADAEPEFEGTGAFRWLKRHAVEFGFELSFPQGNAQGIASEAWHWRFIGQPECERVFERARRAPLSVA